MNELLNNKYKLNSWIYKTIDYKERIYKEVNKYFYNNNSNN